MVRLKISDHLNHCYSNDDGELILGKLNKYFQDEEVVTVSFEGIEGVTSSFVNTAFVELLDNYTFDFIKSHLKIANSTRQINSMIKERLSFESKKRNDLVLT